MPVSPLGPVSGPPDFTGAEYWTGVYAGPLGPVVDRSVAHPTTGLPPAGGAFGGGNLNTDDGAGSGVTVRFTGGSGPGETENGFDVFEYAVPAVSLPLATELDIVAVSLELSVAPLNPDGGSAWVYFGQNDGVDPVGRFDPEFTSAFQMGSAGTITGGGYRYFDAPYQDFFVFFGDDLSQFRFLDAADNAAARAGDLRVRFGSITGGITADGFGLDISYCRVKYWYIPAIHTKPRARIYPRDDQGRLYPTPTATQTPGRLYPGYR